MPLPSGLPRLAFGRPDGLRWEGGRILDGVRRRWVRLSPEEWVRQHVLQFLSDEIGVPRGLVEVERGIRIGGLRRRVDVLVRDRQGAPWMVVECKAPDVPVGQGTADQAGRYNAEVGARFVLVTNGREIRGWAADGSGSFQVLTGLPYFPKR